MPIGIYILRRSLQAYRIWPGSAWRMHLVHPLDYTIMAARLARRQVALLQNALCLYEHALHDGCIASTICCMHSAALVAMPPM